MATPESPANDALNALVLTAMMQAVAVGVRPKA